MSDAELREFRDWCECYKDSGYVQAALGAKVLAELDAAIAALGVSVCGYCRKEFPGLHRRGREAAAAMVEHFKVCEMHPLGGALRENDRLRAENHALREELELLRAGAVDIPA